MSDSVQHGTQGSPQTAIVVGGGFVGATTAYYLAKAGVEVTLIDQARPGSGASGGSAGYISTITRSGGPQLELANFSRSLYAELAEELDDFDFRLQGALLYYFEEQLPLIQPFLDRRRADGLPIDLLDADEARALCPLLPDDLAGGIHSRSDGYIHGQRLIDGLVDALVRLGGQVKTSEVVGLEVTSGRCSGVRTAEGTSTADVVALAAGSWTEKLLAEAGAPLHLFHIRLQGAETAPIKRQFEVNLYGPTFFHEYEFIREVPGYHDDLVLHPLMRIMPEVGMLETLVQRSDGRLLMGCPIEFVEETETSSISTVAGLAHMCGILGDHIPAIQHLPVERTWAGLASQTGDGLPIMDAVDGIEGLFVGAGHAYGATVGSGSGMILADQILGRPSEIDVAPFRYNRPAVQERSTKAVMYG